MTEEMALRIAMRLRERPRNKCAIFGRYGTRFLRVCVRYLARFWETFPLSPPALFGWFRM